MRASLHAMRTLLARDSGFAALTTALFAVAALLGLLRHEMWRDEFQSWMLARDSRSLGDLFYNLRYEGHPALWYLGLYLISRVTRAPLAMQLYHAGLAAGAVYLLARFAPFPRRLKLLYACGYFALYEYALISRSYALSVVLLFAACAVFPRRPRSYLRLGVLIALLVNVSLFSLLIGLTLALAALIPPSVSAQRARAEATGSRWLLALFLLLVLGGSALSITQMRVPASTRLARLVGASSAPLPEERYLPLARSAVAITRAYAPIPRPQWQFWNSHILLTGGGRTQFVLGLLLSLLLAGLALWLLRRHREAWLFYAVGTVGTLLVVFWTGQSQMRHVGHLYLILVAAFWLAGLPSANPPAGPEPDARQQRLAFWFLAALFSLQALAGLYAYAVDFRRMFSASPAAAAYLRAHRLTNMQMIGSDDLIASALSALLDRSIYYAESEREGTFIVLGERRPTFTPRQAFQAARKFCDQAETPVLFLSSHPIESGFADAGMTELARFTDSIVDTERFYLILVQPRSPAATAKP